MLIGHQKLIGDFKSLVANGKLGHGYLFFGAPRVGKKLFAKCIANYLERGEFHESDKILMDFLLIEPDEEGTIGIDEMRRLKKFLGQKPIISKRMTAVINDSEAMTGEAQNAILKIAEEPPESSLLIIIASDSEKLWPTLRSRLQSVYFSNVPEKEITKWMLEIGVCREAEEAKRFANMSFGQPGLAYRFAADKDFMNIRQSAEKFLKSGFWERRNLVKAMLEDENFNLSRFLETALIVIAKNASFNKNAELWHKISALRQNAESYNINPRLQLEALLGGH